MFDNRLICVMKTPLLSYPPTRRSLDADRLFVNKRFKCYIDFLN